MYLNMNKKMPTKKPATEMEHRKPVTWYVQYMGNPKHEKWNFINKYFYSQTAFSTYRYCTNNVHNEQHRTVSIKL